jgi:polyphosphate kinase 2 (PPK2 family)
MDEVHGGRAWLTRRHRSLSRGTQPHGALLAYAGRRLVLVGVERDTAGKGGFLSTLSDHLHLRPCHVMARGKPGGHKRGPWCFQPDVPFLPAAGARVLLDRSRSLR